MKLAHNVFFQLNDNSPAARKKLLESARRNLAGHKGVVAFWVGEICAELNRPVNVRDWDVALHVVFEDKAAQDAYQANSPDHNRFIEEGKANWKNVRVFDSLVE